MFGVGIVFGDGTGGLTSARSLSSSVSWSNASAAGGATFISPSLVRRSALRPGKEATGVNSIRTVLAGIKTCRDRDKPHVIFWDEPDIGLSEGNAASVGKAIADFMADPPKHTKASVVVTHRKALVSELAAANPHYLYLGDADAPGSLEEWLVLPPVVRPLEEVQERALKRFRAIQKVLDRVKKNR